jgi:hypothetical protein
VTESKHALYNRSAKGQARNKRYEEAHPERKNRWDPIMRLRAHPNTKWKGEAK